MSTRTNVGRREFLGISLGALAGASAASGVALALRPRAAWENLHGFPDAPAGLLIEGAAPPAGAAVEVELRVVTPRDETVTVVHRLQVDDRGRVVVGLWYPYETHVNGAYRYHAVVRWDGSEASTAEAAGYEVRPTGWFA
jgi:hypothetical protein